MLLIGPLLAPLQRRGATQRELMGDLSNTASDIVGGLRVLRGIGGEQVFLDRYRRESQATRRAGVAVARLQSVLDALQVFLPGVFVVVVVWIGARYAVAGPDQRRRAGRVLRLRGVPDDPAAHRHRVRQQADPRPGRRPPGLPGAARSTPTSPTPPDPRAVAAAGSELDDARTGLQVAPGRLTAIVSDQPDESAALADRLGLAAARPTTRSASAACRSPGCGRAEVRRRIVVSDTGADAVLGPAPTTGSTIRGADEAALARALRTAQRRRRPRGAARRPRRRGVRAGRSFSGGQRQRLVLARALLDRPRDPGAGRADQSAVDAHTEARIAARLREHRAGRTTVVTTSSPLMLDAADVVAFLEDGRVVAAGTHRELLETYPAYRLTVTRETEMEEVAR